MNSSILPPHSPCTPESEPRVYAIVPCAGRGERAGTTGPKQYEQLAGQSVVARTLKALTGVARLHFCLVVIAPDDELFEAAAPSFAGGVARVGGASRAHSVLAGLHECQRMGARDHDWVVVHDAARCMLQAAWVDRLLDACWHDEVGGLLALPVADTLKREALNAGEPRPRASVTVNRQGLWAAQTPQMFRLGLLELSLRQALSDANTMGLITDEASALELAGYQPQLVMGAWENLKLTWPQDFEHAKRLLATPQPSAYP